MTISMIGRTVFEMILFAFLVWGCFHEERLAAFEQTLLCRLRRNRFRVLRAEDKN